MHAMPGGTRPVSRAAALAGHSARGARRPGRASRLPADPAERIHVGGLAGSGLMPPARA
jgi:hypothetical protein